MGCDIHSHAERLVEGKYQTIAGLKPFDWRQYGMYGFLAGIRNYSGVTPISERRGMPDDASQDVLSDFDSWGVDAHSPSWLSVAELAAFDYNQPVEDRRVTIGNYGGCTAPPGGGEMTTWRDFLGAEYFVDLVRLMTAQADRIVFFFDN